MAQHDLLSPDTQATLLLCGRFAGSEQEASRPLTPTEYNRLGKHLVSRGLRPAHLLSNGPDLPPRDVITPERLDALLRRGVAMALALERWNQLGISVLGRSDAAYPAKLRSRLKAGAPPILYVAGRPELLSSDAICVVGSRDATASGLRFARSAGAACAAEGLAVVSGDARGVDQEAMSGALEAGGSTIGVLAEALGKAVLTKRHRQALMKGTTVLISPFAPEAAFTVAHAMDRNKYLYCMSLAAIIVDSDVRGGTWSGAVENEKHGWVPAFVRVGEEVRKGNPQLAARGLSPITEQALAPNGSLRQHLMRAASTRPTSSTRESLDVLTLPMFEDSHLDPADQPATSASSTAANDTPQRTSGPERETADELFSFFVAKLVQFLDAEPRSEQEVADHFEIERSQAHQWLEKACGRQLLCKLTLHAATHPSSEDRAIDRFAPSSKVGTTPRAGLG